jgi:hypothetical protein
MWRTARSKLALLVASFLRVSCSACSSSLKMDAASSFQTPVNVYRKCNTTSHPERSTHSH